MGVQSYSTKKIDFKFNNTNHNINSSKLQYYNDVNTDLKGIPDIDYSNHTNNVDNYADTIKSTAATAVVGATSILSGILKIGEYASDGLTWVGGMAVSGVARLFGQEEFAENFEELTMDEIARDKVGEMNEMFYEGTELGRSINDASAMRYDSELAQGIQNVTTEVVVIAGATAATVVTGGAAAPVFAAGFAIGAGQSAEKKFQDENRNFWKDSVEIGLDGTAKGLSTVAFGKSGATAFNGVKTISKLGMTGTKELAKETLSAFNRDAIKSTIKNSGKTIAKHTALETLKDEDTWVESAAVLVNDFKTGMQTGDWNVTSMITKTALIYGENYIGNLAGGILSDSVGKIDRITKLYQEGQDASVEKYNVGFKSYREHAEKHVYYVAEYMQDISKDVQGINTDETLFGALSHDLGMKGGYVNYNGKYMKTDKVLEILTKEGKKIDFGDINDYVRKPHPLNSALTVLTDDIIPDGVDKDVVALLAMSHSKSTSGISYFDNPTQWNKCVDDLESALKQYNVDKGTSFNLDTEKLKNMINNPDEFKRLQKEALIIRDGDAMSKVATIDGNTIMQTGNVSEVINHNPRDSFNDIVVNEKAELAGLSDNLKTIDGEYVKDGDVSSGVKFHVGELNTKFSSKTDGESFYRATVDLVEPNQTPHSTLFAIKERIGEVNTYSNCSSREFTINLPKEAEGTELGNWYQEQLDDYIEFLRTAPGKDGKPPIGIDLQLKDGLISKETYDKQNAFYENIKINWK